MRVTITTQTDELYHLDVSGDLELENFKAFIQVETNIPSGEMLLVHSGRHLTDNLQTLSKLGITDNDVILVQRLAGDRSSSAGRPTISQSLPPPLPTATATASSPSSTTTTSSASAAAAPTTAAAEAAAGRGENDPAFLRDMFLSNPHQLALLKQNNSRLADALLSGDMSRFEAVLAEQQTAMAQRQRLRSRMLAADPFDHDAQRLIAEEIRLSNIDANMEAAIEHNPESFGAVIMLYVDCKVNGHPVKAFIDSGAQTTLMSQACAERCNIMRLVDTRFSGLAKGVGVQKILGRVHMGQIQIEDCFLSSSFAILEDQPMDMLLGLDMLKRHQCVIDLKRNVLTIGTNGRATPFLSESQLPACARLSNNDEEAVQQSVQDAEDQQMRDAVQHSGATTHATNKPSTSRSAETTANTPSAESGSDVFPESSIDTVVKGGFTRQQAVEELRRFNGDATQALGSLFAKSFSKPFN